MKMRYLEIIDEMTSLLNNFKSALLKYCNFDYINSQWNLNTVKIFYDITIF